MTQIRKLCWMALAVVPTILAPCAQAVGDEAQAKQPTEAARKTPAWRLSFGIDLGHEDLQRTKFKYHSYDLDLDADGKLKVSLSTGFLSRKVLFEGTIDPEKAVQIRDAATEFVRQNPRWNEKQYADARRIGLSLQGVENPPLSDRVPRAGYGQFQAIVDPVLPEKARLPLGTTKFVHPKWELER